MQPYCFKRLSSYDIQNLKKVQPFLIINKKKSIEINQNTKEKNFSNQHNAKKNPSKSIKKTNEPMGSCVNQLSSTYEEDQLISSCVN